MKQTTFDETDVELKIKGKFLVGEYIEVFLETNQKNVRADCNWILTDPLFKNSALNILEEHQRLFENSNIYTIQTN